MEPLASALLLAMIGTNVKRELALLESTETDVFTPLLSVTMATSAPTTFAILPSDVKLLRPFVLLKTNALFQAVSQLLDVSTLPRVARITTPALMTLAILEALTLVVTIFPKLATSASTLLALPSPARSTSVITL